MKAPDFINSFDNVTIVDKNNTYIEKGAQIQQGTIIYPGVYINKNSKIGANCTLMMGCSIFNSTIENDTFIGNYSIIRNDSKIWNNVIIGPYCEIKNSTIKNNSAIYHKSYVGDSIIGSEVEAGAGLVTANTNFKKGVYYKTLIKNNVKIGANVTLVAPIQIEENTFIAAGSTVTKSNNGNEIIIARAEQITKEKRK
ncbi:MAG: hypothetical protein NC236_00225 [Mycoplasma sp.]|nr:hypothetical protein [Mycoplasma sp.]